VPEVEEEAQETSSKAHEETCRRVTSIGGLPVRARRGGAAADKAVNACQRAPAATSFKELWLDFVVACQSEAVAGRSSTPMPAGRARCGIVGAAAQAGEAPQAGPGAPGDKIGRACSALHHRACRAFECDVATSWGWKCVGS
jgi:hypothetical protein